MRSIYENRNGHHQIWIEDGHGLPLRPEIETWLRQYAKERWIGSCNAKMRDQKATFYNFDCRDTAMLFRLTWA